MTGIKEIELLVQASPRSGASGGTIEVHIDPPEGKLSELQKWLSHGRSTSDA